MTTTTITSKGQIVVPVEIRRHLHIKKGMRFAVVEQNGQIVLSPMNQDYFNSFAGILKSKKGGKSLTEMFLEERRKERVIEDRKLHERSRRK